MELLVLFINTIVISIMCFSLLRIERNIIEFLGKNKSPEKEGSVTDPFVKPKHIYSSSSQIIVPKTPTEIRNQNFKRIKEGVEYGDISTG